MRQTVGGHKAITLRESLLLLVFGAVLGGLVVLIEMRGPGAMPAAIGLALLGASFLVGFAPLHAMLTVVVVTSAFQGFLNDFVGGYARYWKEAVVVALLLRAIRVRPPTPLELAAAGFGVFALGAYLLRGSSLTEVAWGLKLLVMFLAAGWALARLAPGPREWIATYRGFAVVVASGLVIALWQRSIGWAGLIDVGFEYGESVREAADQLRAFGGFVYAAPFAYTMGLAVLCWLALMFARQTRSAVVTIWVPLLAVAAMTMSLNRLAFVGVVATATIIALRYRAAPKLVALGVAAFLGISGLSGGTTAAFLSEGFTLQARSGGERVEIWTARLERLTVLGDGPATAGAAAERAQVRSGLAAGTVVDNQYLAWLSQYGYVFGLLLAATWFCGLSAFMFSKAMRSPPVIAGQLVSGFAIVGAFVVNLWEEFPTNLLIALLIAQAVAARRSTLAAREARRGEASVEGVAPEPLVRASSN